MDAASSANVISRTGNPNIRVYDSLEELGSAAAEALAKAAKEAVAKRGRFSIALAGGQTPRTLYRRLATERGDSFPWGDSHLFFSDERVVPANHPASNYGMVEETLLKSLGRRNINLYRPPTKDDPDACARGYESLIQAFFDPDEPSFDWMLLGLGTDGHVASLFPKSPALAESERLVVAVHDCPKPPPKRVTMTLPLINASAEVHFLVAGRKKQAAVTEVLSRKNECLPAGRVQPVRGSVHWWLDRDAAREQG